jgi:V/A-type H+-transporting ATPase subunit C
VIEIALTYSHGYGCISEALRRKLIEIQDNLRRFYDPEIWERIKTIFLRSDVQNLKSIIRGIIHKTDPAIIMNSLSPLGVIPEQYISRIAQSRNIQDAIDRMAVYQLEFAPHLLALKGSSQFNSSAELERVLEYWYFNQTEAILKGRDENLELLRKANVIEIDITNINTLLRFIDAPDSLDMAGTSIEHFLIGGGSFAEKTLVSLSYTASIEKAIRQLAAKKYQPYLIKALDCYQETHLLSEFENQIRIYALRWLSMLPKLNPFGVGVPMGYIALKKSEIRNIRWIAKGISAGFETQFIIDNIEKIQ